MPSSKSRFQFSQRKLFGIQGGGHKITTLLVLQRHHSLGYTGLQCHKSGFIASKITVILHQVVCWCFRFGGKKLAGNEELFGTKDEPEDVELELEKWHGGILTMYKYAPFERHCNNNVQLV